MSMSVLNDWRRWLLRLGVVTTIVALLAAHGAMLYGVASHIAVPTATLVSGMVILVVLKHLGLLGALFAAIKRRFF